MDTGGPQHDVHPPDCAQFTGDSLFHMTCGCFFCFVLFCFLLLLFVLLPITKRVWACQSERVTCPAVLVYFVD